jgi:phosphoenolpyruvate synthase/pyruvate phosphate dikinase
MSEEWFIVEKAEITHYLFAAAPLRSMTYEFENFGFTNMRESGGEYIKEGGNYVFIKREWEEKAREFLQIILKNPEKLDKVNKEMIEIGNELLDYCKELLKKDFTKYDNKQLADFYDKFRKLRNAGHIRRGIMWIMETGEEVFSKHITKYLTDEIKKQKLDLIPDVVFAVLSTPLKRNYPAKEKEEFVKTAIELKKLSKVTDKIIKEKLKEHMEKYRWLPYGLGGPAWDDEYFINKIKEEIKKETLEEELKTIKQEIPKIKEQKQEILEKLKIDLQHKELIRLAEDSIYIKAFTKDVMFFGYYAIESLLKEIARRLGINLRLIRRMLPWEIGEALKGKGVDKKELEERWKYSFQHVKDRKTTVYTGKEARKFVEKLNIKREEEITSVKELKGTCARPGQAKGKVKIINGAKDLEKMNQGDILVSRMTEPEIIVAMKKASAIITDMGGITCHAAIVSRELGIPCVIGTRIATILLKDNDLVKVNADKGTVTILKKH